MSKWSISILCIFCLTPIVSASDWPTYLGDNARTGASPEQLKLPLKQRWAYSSPIPPQRAWSGPEGRIVEGKELRDRVKFDDVFQTAIVGNRIYFGSSLDHQVHCLDADSGKEVWSFFTGGPIRLAPTVQDGRLYVGSDDGYAYCLDAEDGRLIWKLMLGPDDEWIIGRGEMISRWPVRTGILVDNGIAYFGAGIFPHENVYLCAASTEDGSLIWKNDQISHLDAGRNDLSPQGYLLATEHRLYIPSSRSRPKAVDRTTGKLAGAGAESLKLSETQIAGTDAVIVDGKLHIFSLGTRVAAAGDSIYVATGNEVMRKKNDEVIWQTPCTAEAALIIAGDHVLAGSDGQVTAFETETGQEVWSVAVEGEARGLAVANGQLLVSTTAGKIYCFAEESAEMTDQPLADPYPSDELTAMYQRAAEEILKATNVTRVFSLVVGSEQGRLAYELR